MKKKIKKKVKINLIQYKEKVINKFDHDFNIFNTIFDKKIYL